MSDWSTVNGNSTKPQGFFAYSSTPPSIPETIKAAVQAINRTNNAEILPWEALQNSGKVIIGEICEAIDHAQFFCADVTTINANVLFEIGFAIARNKRIWLVRDDSYADSRKDFDQLRMLTTVGYSPYQNSEHIIKAFFAEQPHLTPDQTIFRESIESALGPSSGAEALLYLKCRHDTEASVRITRVLQDSKLPLVMDDPRETSVQPLVWYAQKLYRAIGLTVHFLGASREGFRLHNAKYALVSGLAKGFDVRTLMLTEQDDLLSPIDYRDSMRYYTTPAEAARETESWIQPELSKRAAYVPEAKKDYTRVLRLAMELKDFHLNLGEYVAENEASRLHDYFVETTAYSDVLNGTHAIFVGRKGTGKTANLIRAANQIGAEVQNLVVIIKPIGYEIEGLARIFASYKLQDQKGYVIESLWKFMLYTEIAHTLLTQLQETALWQLSEPIYQNLLHHLNEEHSPFFGDFNERLERVVVSLGKLAAVGSSDLFRTGISEALHVGALGRLRTLLVEPLSKKHQILLLADNLDKPWTKSADLDQLSDFLLGLLGAANRVGEELRRKTKGKKPVVFHSAIFLRSDIFNRITAIAREPDKLSVTRLKWDDPEVLLRVVEERYIASHGSDSDPAEMWHRFFTPQVRGIPTREYLTSRVLWRPRDIVFFVKSAVSFAVNRKHDRVEEKDVLDGEKQYSQFALDSILVENGISIPALEGVLLEFVGSAAIVEESYVRQCIERAGLSLDKVDSVIEHLVNLTFLGLEVARGRFVYSDDPKNVKKHRVFAGHYADQAQVRRYEINSAFRAYLEINELDSP